jgi:hypothetical protein
MVAMRKESVGMGVAGGFNNDGNRFVPLKMVLFPTHGSLSLRDLRENQGGRSLSKNLRKPLDFRRFL